ncbi:MAG TPA: hypothetical protein VF286_01250 [Acidiphilium sp.]
MHRARFCLAVPAFVLAMSGMIPGVFAQAPQHPPPPAGLHSTTGEVAAAGPAAQKKGFILQRQGWWYLGPGFPFNHVTGPVPTYRNASTFSAGPQADLAPPPIFAGPPPVFPGPPPIVSLGLRFNTP